MREFVENTMGYLEEYHQRSNSEAVFTADEKMLWWNVVRGIERALFFKCLWHIPFRFDR